VIECIVGERLDERLSAAHGTKEIRLRASTAVLQVGNVHPLDSADSPMSLMEPLSLKGDTQARAEPLRSRLAPSREVPRSHAP